MYPLFYKDSLILLENQYRTIILNLAWAQYECQHFGRATDLTIVFQIEIHAWKTSTKIMRLQEGRFVMQNSTASFHVSIMLFYQINHYNVLRCSIQSKLVSFTDLTLSFHNS